MLCEKYGLQIVHKFQLGNVCKAVFRVQDLAGNTLVLKVGTDARGMAEIRRNKIGYDKLISLGLDSFIPRIHAYEINDFFAVLLMEDCGEDVLTQIKKSDNPAKLYDLITEGIEPVYRRSKRQGADGSNMIQSVQKKIKEQYQTHLRSPFDPEGCLEAQIRSMDAFIDHVSVPFFCFSNWDFTPDDVYLTTDGIKYSDPHEEVTGNPIIDMACFAGVAVAHGLPGSVEAYGRIEAFAIQRVADILEIDEHIASKLFFLGRILQCFLSTRFRGKEFPEQAKQLFAEARIYLEKVTA